MLEDYGILLKVNKEYKGEIKFTEYKPVVVAQNKNVTVKVFKDIIEIKNGKLLTVVNCTKVINEELNVEVGDFRMKVKNKFQQRYLAKFTLDDKEYKVYFGYGVSDDQRRMLDFGIDKYEVLYIRDIIKCLL